MRKLLFFALALLLSCNNNSSNETDGSEHNGNNTMEAALQCKKVDGQDPYLPAFEISLELNGKMHLMDTIMGCDLIKQSDFANYDVPEDALTACGGWYAGAGDYFYAVNKNDKCVVYRGWQDEMQEDEGFHYVVFTEIVF